MSNPWLKNKGESDRPRKSNERPARSAEHADRGESAGRPSRDEVRWYGFNAVLATFAQRPEAIRKVYVSGSRLRDAADLLKWCADNRIGYRVVDDADLERLTKSQHHEGLVADVLPLPVLDLQEWLDSAPSDRDCAIWLDGVGNPHNLGAILRSAAHFGASALLLPPARAAQGVAGAAARVAEGGAEHVRLVALRERPIDNLTILRRHDYRALATVVEGGTNLFRAEMPAKTVWMLGAEGEGMDRSLAELADAQISIPGTGNVESLNVANAAAVLLAASFGATE